MRIVAIADTHTRERDLGNVPNGDLLVHAGDMLETGTMKELWTFIEWLDALPHPTRILVAGNSDWCFALDLQGALRVVRDRAIYLQDSGVTIGGLNIWGSPWQPEYRTGAFNRARGVPLREKWSLIPDGTDLLVTHTPPRGIGDRSLVGDVGCDDLLKETSRVRPLVHLFGHVHGDGGVWHRGDTTFANVTTWNGQRGATVLDVDLAARSVVEVAVPPSRSWD